MADTGCQSCLAGLKVVKKLISVKDIIPVNIKIDGSGRQTLRNRKFLRKFIPMYQLPKRRSIIEDITRLPPNPPPDHDDTAISPLPSALNPTPTNSESSRSREVKTSPATHLEYTYTGTHTHSESEPGTKTIEVIHQNNEAPRPANVMKISLQPIGNEHTNVLKTWGEIENIEQNY